MIRSIISLIVIVISLGFAFLYVLPAYNLNIERRGNIDSLAKILSTSEEIKVLIDKTKTNLNSIDPTVLSRFEVFLPEKVDSVRFANNIQSIALHNKIIVSSLVVESPDDLPKTDTAGTAGTMLNQVLNGGALGTPKTSPSATITSAKYAKTRATLSFLTSYEAFQLFLNDLEKSLGVINVTSLSFAPLPTPTDASGEKNINSSSSPLYQFTMVIETYSLK